jgi:hypothetical protein
MENAPFPADTATWIDHIRILPTLALLFLCSFIDRTNVGNAKILGLQKSINITDHQYAIGLCVFYATYIARYINFPPRNKDIQILTREFEVSCQATLLLKN